MILVAKDKHQTINDPYDISIEEADAMGFYLIDDPVLEAKIQFAYPDFEFVLDGEGNVTDIVTDKVPYDETLEAQEILLDHEFRISLLELGV